MKGMTSTKEDVMLWFLNPHVKRITLPGRLCTEKVINQLQIVGTGITAMNLHRSGASENELETILSCVPCVKILDLSNTSCTDNTLSVIQRACPVIENLNLGECEKITDDGMKNLCGENHSLKMLDLLSSNIEDLGVCTVLRGMPFLECIRYCDLADLLVKISYDHQKYDFTEIKYYNLTELIFYDRPNVDPLKVIKTWTQLCPKIKRVHFELTVDFEVLLACMRFQELEELKIKGYHGYGNYERSQMGYYLAPIVPIAIHLKTLILSCLGIDTLMLIQEFRNLEKLYMKNVTLTSVDPASIACTENKLDVLVIRDTRMDAFSSTYEAIISLISLSKNVTKLHIGYNSRLPRRVLDMISYSMKKLSSVHFSYADVELHSLIPFFNIPSLNSIYVNGLDGIGDFAKEKLSSKSSSTLFWRSMYDAEDSEDENIENDEIPFEKDVSVTSDYDNYSTDDSMSDDVISIECNSDDNFIFDTVM